MAKLVLPNLSYLIVGCLFDVHQNLGPSMLEKYYQRAIAKSLKEKNLDYKKELKIQLEYKGKKIGWYSLDFLVENQVILEVKAKRSYNPLFFKQVLAYLKSSNLPLAIVANFRRPSLEYKRVINANFQDSKQLEVIDERFKSLK